MTLSLQDIGHAPEPGIDFSIKLVDTDKFGLVLDAGGTTALPVYPVEAETATTDTRGVAFLEVTPTSAFLQADSLADGQYEVSIGHIPFRTYRITRDITVGELIRLDAGSPSGPPVPTPTPTPGGQSLTRLVSATVQQTSANERDWIEAVDAATYSGLPDDFLFVIRVVDAGDFNINQGGLSVMSKADLTSRWVVVSTGEVSVRVRVNAGALEMSTQRYGDLSTNIQIFRNTLQVAAP